QGCGHPFLTCRSLKSIKLPVYELVSRLSSPKYVFWLWLRPAQKKAHLGSGLHYECEMKPFLYSCQDSAWRHTDGAVEPHHFTVEKSVLHHLAGQLAVFGRMTQTFGKLGGFDQGLLHHIRCCVHQRRIEYARG